MSRRKTFGEREILKESYDGLIKKEILSNIKTMDNVKKVYEDLLDLGAIIGMPVIENDVLFVPAADGYLYAYE